MLDSFHCLHDGWDIIVEILCVIKGLHAWFIVVRNDELANDTIKALDIKVRKSKDKGYSNIQYYTIRC